jgi:glycosyltransferase involved in cell wall biosynthesis
MIAQLCFSKAKGGLELSALKLTEDFHREGFKSVCICRTGTFLAETAAAKNLTTFGLNPHSGYFSPSTSLKLRRFIKDRGVTAVFVHTLRDLWLLTPALWGLPKVRVVGFAHMFISDVNKKDFFHRLMYASLDRLVVMTLAQKEGLLKCLPVPDEKYLLIPNGVDTRKFSPGPKDEGILRQWGVENGETVVGYVGRLDPQKGVFEFAEAAASLKHRRDLKFIMVGDDTLPSQPTKNRLIARLSELGLRDRLKLIPFNDQVPALMRNFDLFVMPSYEECFGLVLIEAMATGLACVSTQAGGPPEILDHGTKGMLIPPRSAEALTGAITELLEHPQKRKSLGEEARKRAVEVFDSRLVFEKIKSLVS